MNITKRSKKWRGLTKSLWLLVDPLHEYSFAQQKMARSHQKPLAFGGSAKLSLLPCERRDENTRDAKHRPCGFDTPQMSRAENPSLSNGRSKLS